jgi:cephalosporin hydroxylase
MPTALYDRIGGIDEAFTEPGAGFANLDLFRRAADAASVVVALVGEATFHQYHGGMTTNVPDEEKDTRVRAYSRAYSKLRGVPFKAVEPSEILLRGTIRSEGAISVRSRSLLPMGLGVTARLRRGTLHEHFDEGSQAYLNATYAECALHEETRWLGRRVPLAPTDLVAIQEIIAQLQPECVVTTCQDPGLLWFIRSVLDMSGLAASTIVFAGPCVPGDAPAGMVVVHGSHDDARTLERVGHAVGGAETTLVLFAPDADDATPSQPLQAYSRFVSFRSYLVFLGSAFSQPLIGYSNRWYQAAIRGFVSEPGSQFVIDHSRTRHLLTMCPSGYLRRTRHATDVSQAVAAIDFEDTEYTP